MAWRSVRSATDRRALDPQGSRHQRGSTGCLIQRLLNARSAGATVTSWSGPRGGT